MSFTCDIEKIHARCDVRADLVLAFYAFGRKEQMLLCEYQWFDLIPTDVIVEENIEQPGAPLTIRAPVNKAWVKSTSPIWWKELVKSFEQVYAATVYVPEHGRHGLSKTNGVVNLPSVFKTIMANNPSVVLTDYRIGQAANIVLPDDATHYEWNIEYTTAAVKKKSKHDHGYPMLRFLSGCGSPTTWRALYPNGMPTKISFAHDHWTLVMHTKIFLSNGDVLTNAES
jgi:hypothetical protein